MNVLVTGAAGFIGANLSEYLIKKGYTVTLLDSFLTGHPHNIQSVKDGLNGDEQLRFRFIEGDIRDADTCRKAAEGQDYILHQAALGSVPRSMENPFATHDHNVNGFLNMIIAARDAGVKRFVYASSSSVYGDHPKLPKTEDEVGNVLSPYALTKKNNEQIADLFYRVYGVPVIGMRYFNVFGRRQDPNGVYAAVIPRWIKEFLDGKAPVIFGDGETSRDFCYIDNVLQANEKAMLTDNPEAINQAYNVAAAGRTTLNELYQIIGSGLEQLVDGFTMPEPQYADFRAGDIRHSFADVSRARQFLSYDPSHDVRSGLAECLGWYVKDLQR